MNHGFTGKESCYKDWMLKHLKYLRITNTPAVMKMIIYGSLLSILELNYKKVLNVFSNLWELQNQEVVTHLSARLDIIILFCYINKEGSKV